jgi:hypothetical protein
MTNLDPLDPQHPENQRLIKFAQSLLDSTRFKKATRFNSPDFLRCAVKHGLLKSTASAHDAYEVFGKLLINKTLFAKRIELGMVAGIEALTPEELRSVRESVAGVLSFKSSVTS